MLNEIWTKKNLFVHSLSNDIINLCIWDESLHPLSMNIVGAYMFIQCTQNQLYTNYYLFVFVSNICTKEGIKFTFYYEEGFIFNRAPGYYV